MSDKICKQAARLLWKKKSEYFCTRFYNKPRVLKMAKRLAAFDFDHTIVEDNSDTAIWSLLSGGIPAELKVLHKKDGWTAFMQEIFNLMHKQNVAPSSIEAVIKKLKPVNGMIELIKELNENLNFDIIIISDSNTHFINTWLNEQGLNQNVNKVFTNPARFENGLLKIEMYHFQDHCDISTKNLCKGQILQDFIENQQENGVTYEQVVYAGDGSNDFCPMLRLSENDVAFARKGFKICDILQDTRAGKMFDKSGKTRTIYAKVVHWKDAFDILNFFKQ